MNEDAIFNIDFEISFYRLLEFIELNFEFIKVLIMNMNNTYFRALLVQKVREKSIILYWRKRCEH